MFCTNCGYKVADTSSFCTECGHDLSPIVTITDNGTSVDNTKNDNNSSKSTTGYNVFYQSKPQDNKAEVNTVPLPVEINIYEYGVCSACDNVNFINNTHCWYCHRPAPFAYIGTVIELLNRELKRLYKWEIFYRICMFIICLLVIVTFSALLLLIPGIISLWRLKVQRDNIKQKIERYQQQVLSLSVSKQQK
ncbi:MAG: zinc ribbon domain-containing protein [bacterium]